MSNEKLKSVIPCWRFRNINKKVELVSCKLELDFSSSVLSLLVSPRAIFNCICIVKMRLKQQKSSSNPTVKIELIKPQYIFEEKIAE